VKAAHDSGRMTIEPSIVTAAFVPVAAFAIWWTVRRIRKKHTPARIDRRHPHLCQAPAEPRRSACAAYSAGAAMAIRS